MDEQILKAALNNGALMLFFVGVGIAAYKWLPVLFAKLSDAFKEMVIALNSSTSALNNSTSALNANNEALAKHHETMTSVREVWDQMRERIDTFQCPANPPPSCPGTVVSIKSKVSA